VSNLVNYTIQDDGMAFVTLNAPPVNALSTKFISELHDAIKAVKIDNTVRVMVLSSSGKHFCAGMDLKEQTTLTIDEGNKVVVAMNDCFNDIANLPFPTISAVNGIAAGGGGELALSCDFRVLDETAKIGFPEVSLGLIPGAGGTQRLPRLIGPSNAKYWIFSGKLFSAEEALADGVSDFISNQDEVLETAIEIATDFLTNAPFGLQAAKYAIDNGLNTDLQSGLKIEQTQFEFTQATEDRAEGISAFIEKREANWSKK
jgi:enoyl-CoA hydratase/carnithine racemase